MPTANELLLEACASGVSCLGELDLLRIIAQGASTGGGGGGGGGTLSTDGTFAANSDLLYPSQKAAKTYVDTGIAAALVTADGLYVKKAGDTMTGALLQPAGSAGAPALARSTDPDTGLWYPGANLLALSTGGTERLRIIADGKVGIGVAPPLAQLHITPSASGTNYLRIDHSDGTPRLQVGVLPISASFSALWLGDVVPVDANHNLRGDGTNTILNAPTGGQLDFNIGLVNFWTISTTALRAQTDNAVDIGVSGANRPRDLFVARDVTTNNAAAVIKTSVAMTSGAGAGVGTISNAPSAGNPAVWCPIMLNGVTHWFPCWT